MKNMNYIITGGGGKLGLAISESIRAKKGNVISLGRSFKSSTIAEKSSYVEVKCDVTNELEFNKVFMQIENKYAHIHGLVNCTSYRPMTKYMDDTIENWEDSIRQNSLALFIPTRTVLFHMLKHRIQGSIVTISSMYGSVSPQNNLYKGCSFETEPDYVYNKSASIGFTRFIGCKYASKNIRANVVTPGGFFNNQSKEFLSNYENTVPIGRMANGKDIMGIVTFLLSEESSYITGAVIPVDGGWTGI